MLGIFLFLLCSHFIYARTYYSNSSSSQFPQDDLYDLAVDYQQTSILSAHVRCFKASTYGVYFIGTFLPWNNGILDPNATDTIKKAHEGGMRVEISMHVKLTSKYSGAEQLDIVVDALEKEKIKIQTVWVLATTLTDNESEWPLFNQTASYLFLKSYVDRAAELGISVGIYTNKYDWDRIVGKRTFTSDVMLWYHNVRRPGQNGETEHNFDDFTPFGPFTKPTIKQFAHGEILCQLRVSRNVYKIDSLVPLEEVNSSRNGWIYVGGNFKK